MLCLCIICMIIKTFISQNVVWKGICLSRNSIYDASFHDITSYIDFDPVGWFLWWET